MDDVTEIARRHYDADTEALGADERLQADEPVAFLTGMERRHYTSEERRAVGEAYRRLRDEHDGRPRTTVSP